jgi:cytidylate kinase
MARSLITLTPHVEHRILAWEALGKHLAAQQKPSPRPTITLSRQFGCEGYPVAEKAQALLAAATGEPWAVYDKVLLEKVASEQGIDLATLQHLGETARSLEKLGMRPQAYHQHAEAFRAVAEKMRQVAAVGNAIIVGRGGVVVCQGQPNCFHFRISAGAEWRVDSIARRLEVPRDEARVLVDANQSLRQQFLTEQLKVDPNLPDLFDVTFNNERAGADAIAQGMAAYVQRAWADRRVPLEAMRGPSR